MYQHLTKQSFEGFSSDTYSVSEYLFILNSLCGNLSLLSQVCDMFLKFGLPLIMMPPPGVFYPALLATDPVSVDRLAYIMHRWGLFISVPQPAVSLLISMHMLANTLNVECHMLIHIWWPNRTGIKWLHCTYMLMYDLW